MMRVKILAVLSAVVLVTAIPQPARFDQRQSGTYNLHLDLKDGQVYAVVKNVLVSAPVRNFAVTLKGPIAQPTTESPRTDARTGVLPQPSKGGDPSSNLKSPSPSVDTRPSLKNPVFAGTQTITPNTATFSKPPSVEVPPNLKVAFTGVPSNLLKESNVEAAVVTPLNQNNGTSNSRRQNNKVASQIIIQQTTTSVSRPLPPPPVHTQPAKQTLYPLPPLPPSIIAALTDQRTTNQRIQALSDQQTGRRPFMAEVYG